MNPIGRVVGAMCGVLLLLPLIPALAGQTQEAKGATPAVQELPPGEGKDVLLKQCSGCHQLNVVTSQHKSESAWTDTVIEMRNRGANGSDEEMEQIIHYLATNYGPASAAAKVNVNTASAAELMTGLMLSPSEADAVVTFRVRNGKFKDIASLQLVAGVDAAKIEAAKDRIEF